MPMLPRCATFPTRWFRTVAPRIALIGIALILRNGVALAEDKPADSPDKTQFTLFNPTPDDAMRGMDTDRPNKTNTAHTIDAGHVQIETGFFDWVHYRNRYQAGNVTTDTVNLGHFNVRLGLLNNLEVNAAFDSYDFYWNKDYAAGQSTRQNGFGDTTLGGKLNLWGAEGSDETWATAMALQPQFKIGTAKPQLGNGHTELFVGAPFMVNLPADFHLALQTTVSWERNRANTGEVTGWQNSASLDRVLIGKLDAYVEYWSHWSTERHQQPTQTVDVGFTYPLTDNLVVDMGANFGLNKASNTVEWLAGMSLRF